MIKAMVNRCHPPSHPGRSAQSSYTRLPGKGPCDLSTGLWTILRRLRTGVRKRSSTGFVTDLAGASEEKLVGRWEKGGNLGQAFSREKGLYWDLPACCWLPAPTPTSSLQRPLPKWLLGEAVCSLL